MPLVAQHRTKRFRPVLVAGLLGTFVGLGGCFDSDDTFRLGATTGEPDPDPSTSSSTTSMESSSSDSSSSGIPDRTCRDAITCIRDCALSIGLDPNPEPDLSCFLDCEEDLTVREAYHLLRLANCAAEDCQMRDACDDGMGTSGSGSGTAGEDDGGGGGGGGNDLIDPCLGCIFIVMQDANSSVCEEFQDQCI